MNIIVTDRQTIERGRVVVPSPYAVISIADPGRAKARIRRVPWIEGILYLSFHDADPQHLRNLQTRFSQLATYKIIKTPKRDYGFRLVVPRPLWVDVAIQLAKDIDYDNFKGACSKERSLRANYLHSLHDVRETMFQLQHGAKR